MKTMLYLVLAIGVMGCGLPTGHPGGRPTLHMRFEGLPQNESVAQNAARQWRDTCGFDVTVGPDGDYPIRYNPQLGPNALGRSYFGIDSRIEYHYADVEVETFTHEMGHMLGLEHVSDPQDVMYKDYDGAPVRQVDCDAVLSDPYWR